MPRTKLENKDGDNGLTPEQALRMRLRMADLLTALLNDYPSPKGAQTALAREIGLKQAAVSGYLNPRHPESRMTSKETDIKIVNYLKKKHSAKWTVQKLYTFIEGEDSFDVYNNKIKNEDVPVESLSLKERLNMASVEEKRQALMFLVTDLFMGQDEKKSNELNFA